MRPVFVLVAFLVCSGLARPQLSHAKPLDVVQSVMSYAGVYDGACAYLEAGSREVVARQVSGVRLDVSRIEDTALVSVNIDEPMSFSPLHVPVSRLGQTRIYKGTVTVAVRESDGALVIVVRQAVREGTTAATTAVTTTIYRKTSRGLALSVATKYYRSYSGTQEIGDLSRTECLLLSR